MRCCTKQVCLHKPVEFWRNTNGSLLAYCKHHARGVNWVMCAEDRGWNMIAPEEYYALLNEKESNERDRCKEDT